MITWEQFFAYHPMKGGSDTGDKKEEEIKQAIKIIAINWLKMYWPNSDQINMVSECDEAYKLEDPEKAANIETYFWDNFIVLLLHKRMYDLKRWDYKFEIQPYFQPDPRVIPRRLGGTVVFPELESYLSRFSQQIVDTWKMTDKMQVLVLAQERLQRFEAGHREQRRV